MLKLNIKMFVLSGINEKKKIQFNLTDRTQQ